MSPYTTAFFLFIGLIAASQEGYQIKVALKPFENQFVYLGHYYGNKLLIVDSALLNEKSEGAFKGNKKLGRGIYFITYPDYKIYFNLLLDKNQKFSVEADTSLPAAITFLSSPENTIYANYLDSIKRMNGHLNRLEQHFKTNKQDSSRIVKEYEQTQTAINSYRIEMIQKHPNSLLSVLLKAMMDPAVPENDPAAKTDSLFAYKYIKAHYWDGVSFYDDRIINTPILQQKLDFYFNRLVYPSADSVNKEIDWMLGYASINAEMQKFLLPYFINRYLNQKYSWEEMVFLNLYEKYISDKDYPWLANAMRKTITAKANVIMANTKGKPAADIELPDRTGKSISLYSIQAPYALLVIWDVTCNHCKHILPILDSLYQTRWKDMGLQIFAMAKESDGKKEDWTFYIDQKKLNAWMHVYYSKADDKARTENSLLGYTQLYDVTSFPTLYLLDKDKHIIAKKISYNLIDGILEQMHQVNR